MRNLTIIIFILAILTACSSNPKKQFQGVAFTTRHISLPVDTTIQSIAFLDNYLLLLQDNGKIIVLDTAYNRIPNLEKAFASLKPNFLIRYNDTLFLADDNKVFYLNTSFSPIEYKVKRRMFGEVLFEDSTYLVYGCCAGEFGGSVFFLNKLTDKTYSYFATCPNQVVRFGKDYVVCNNLAHLTDHMSFLLVKDPTTLYEITDNKLKNHCNWYVTIDSLKEYWQISKVGAVRFSELYEAMSLITFPFLDSLYSIISVPKATLLVVHRGDTTITKDTIFNKKISFHETQVIEAGNKKVCLYKLTEGSPFAAYFTRGNNTGLIVVVGNRIDFLDRSQ